MKRCLLLSGGYGHDFAESSTALADLLCDAGWDCRIETDVRRAIAHLADADLLMVNGLWWSMTQDAKYAADRDAFAFYLADADFRALLGHVVSGGSLFALHTATIAFDTQPEWKTLLGGGWTWGRSHHPPPGPLWIETHAPGLKAFAVVDEAYHHLDPAADCTLFASCTLSDGPQPLAWTRAVGAGRVAVNALGHNGASLRVPGHRALINAQLAWLENAS